MKTILACLLVLAVSVTLSNAYCFVQPLKPKDSKGCYDSKGELHKFGTEWTNEDCHDCSCSMMGIECCANFAIPRDYDREKCIAIFNKQTCIYKVLEKEDYSKECPVHGWVG